ncbi:MHC class II transactivator [Alosa alosa]|uniref:MHC class II transactivator n=1 Tax=Alosa alosa TaxID=278164 RepID=UPI0020153AE7|nr:MHC class II transactivator [Alosa alosa]
MYEDSVKVTFDQVLDQLRWVLQVASPWELHSLFQKMLETQVFPNYHYLSLSEEAHCLSESAGAGDTDQEDLARRMALPMWQRWDTCQGILQSMFIQEADSSLEFTSTSCESGNFWDSWNVDTIECNVKENTDLLNDEDVDGFDEESALVSLFSNTDCFLDHVSSDQDHGTQGDTEEVELTLMETVCFPPVSESATEKGEAMLPPLLEQPDYFGHGMGPEKVHVTCPFTALPVTKDSDQAPDTQKTAGNRSLHKRSRCRKSQSKEPDGAFPSKRPKRTKPTQKVKEIPSDNLGDTPENFQSVRRVVTLSSPQQFVPISPTAAIVPFANIANFNTATLLPSTGGAPTFHIIQTHSLSPTSPTYILVPTTPQKQMHQIVPLSPISGTVAPELLLVSPGGSLSDSVNRSTPPEPITLSSPTRAIGSLATPERGVASPGSSSSDRTTPGETVTISSPTTETNPRESADVVAANPQLEHVEEEPCYVGRYLQHVKSCMRESCGELEKDRSMESHYVNVHLLQRKVLVKSGKHANKCLEKEMVILSDAERKKATLTRKQVFADGQLRQKQVIALLGKPGAGKSAFIKRLCLDWAKGELLRFRYVFSLNCKTLNLKRSNYSLKRLLFDLPTSLQCEDPEAVFKHMISAPKEVLIIFDSFEDFKDHEGLLHSPATCTEAGGYSIKQLFSGLFLKHLLKGCTLLIAARPCGGLMPLLRKVDSILELCGFSPVEIDLYTSLYFMDDAPHGARALTKMKLQKYIYSLCSNPLLCRYTCFLLDHLDNNKRFALPSTLTGLALRVLSLCLKQTSQAQGKETPDISQLCALAWESLSAHSTLVADEQLESTELRDYGLASEMLTSHTVGNADGAGEMTGHSFSHALIQNLLASLHLVLSESVSDKALVNQTMSTSRRRRLQCEWLGMMQQFTAGLLFQKSKLPECGIAHSTTTSGRSAKKKAVEAHLDSLKSGEMAPARLLELCHCVYETGSKKLAKQLVKNLPDTVSLCGAQLTPPDVYVLWYLLQDTKALKRQFCIDLQDTGITLSGLKELVGLNCITSYRAPLADTIAMWEEIQQSGELDLLRGAMNKLTLHPFKATQEDHICNLTVLIRIHRERNLLCRDSALLEHDIPAIRQLEELDFELGPNIGPVIFPKLAQILPTLGRLVHLDLEKNKIGDSGAELLADVLNSLLSLKKLNLSQNLIGDKGLEKLAPALAAMPSLQGLSLYNNLIAESGAERLALVLPEMRALIDLDVGFNNFTDVGAQKLSDSLKYCPWMKSLGMWNHYIPYGILQHLHQQDKRIRIQHS